MKKGANGKNLSSVMILHAIKAHVVTVLPKKTEGVWALV